MRKEEKFLKICQEKHFFKEHKRVLLAISGGRDSMTLFNWLHSMRDELGITIFCAHVNYDLRLEAADEEKILKKMMQDQGISLDIAHYKGKSHFTEEKGREFRYQFFKDIMEKHQCTALVTAHHKDDNVETLVMREIRGSRLFDARGILERQLFGNGELIRPLLTFTKSELDASDYFEDKTNNGTDYFRNRVRNQMIPFLVKENPKFVEGASRLTEEINFATQLIREKIENLNLLSSRVNLMVFKIQSEAVQYFALQLYIEQYAPDLQPKMAQFKEFLRIIHREQQYNEKISSHYYFVKTATEFYLTDKTSTVLLDICTENPNDSSFLQINFPVGQKYVVRERQGGDYLQIRGLHKKIKRFFIDEKIALEVRESPLITVNSEVYAIPAIRIVSDLSNSLENATMKTTIWVKPIK